MTTIAKNGQARADRSAVPAGAEENAEIDIKTLLGEEALTMLTGSMALAASVSNPRLRLIYPHQAGHAGRCEITGRGFEVPSGAPVPVLSYDEESEGGQEKATSDIVVHPGLVALGADAVMHELSQNIQYIREEIAYHLAQCAASEKALALMKKEGLPSQWPAYWLSEEDRAFDPSVGIDQNIGSKSMNGAKDTGYKGFEL